MPVNERLQVDGIDAPAGAAGASPGLAATNEPAHRLLRTAPLPGNLGHREQADTRIGRQGTSSLSVR